MIRRPLSIAAALLALLGAACGDGHIGGVTGGATPPRRRRPRRMQAETTPPSARASR